MIDQSALEQGSVTYQEIVAEGKRLVDALKELAVEPKQQNFSNRSGGEANYRSFERISCCGEYVPSGAISRISA